MNFIDSHCHIDGQAYDEDRSEVIKNALEAGVCAMLNVGTGKPDSESFEKTAALTRKYPGIYGAVGIHPHDARFYDEKTEKMLVGLLKNNEKLIAWGEIGLDYFYEHSPRETQQKVFRRQLNVARRLDLPVIIHSREANEDTVKILREECGGVGFRGGIMHCFGGTPEMAGKLIELGFLISFAGNVTFKKADDLRAAARVVPLDKLLIETDCPYLTPVPFRGKRNEPARVVETGRFLADLLGVRTDRLASQTTENFIRFFSLTELSPSAS